MRHPKDCVDRGRPRIVARYGWPSLLLSLAAIAACSDSSSDANEPLVASDEPQAQAPASPAAKAAEQSPSAPEVDLAARKVNYGEALRTASLKLVGDLPTLASVQKIANASTDADKKAAYEAEIDRMLGDARFAGMMRKFWQDTFRTGAAGMPSRQNAPASRFDAAANFAAQVVVQDRPYTDLLTARSGTCPTFDEASGTFTAASCPGGAPTSGVLTDPGLMAQYYANMAFRRVKFIQEIFVCSKFPAEASASSKPMGAGAYTSPWDFGSISGKQSNPPGRVDFHDTSSAVCANCHTTMNHIAPLFAYFAEDGSYTPGVIQVKTPSEGEPTSVLADWLPPGQGFAWRNGKPVADIPALGAEMAKDPDVARCAVNRVWNYAMSRGDIVAEQALIPVVVTDTLANDFKNGGFKLKATIRAVFTSPDFVQF